MKCHSDCGTFWTGCTSLRRTGCGKCLRCRGDAEKLPLLPSVAVISITAPERPPANLGSFAHVLRLSFADVDFLNPHLSGRAQEKLVHAFTDVQAQAVRSFVEALPDAIKSVVVHCRRRVLALKCDCSCTASTLWLPRRIAIPLGGKLFRH